MLQFVVVRGSDGKHPTMTMTNVLLNINAYSNLVKYLL